MRDYSMNTLGIRTWDIQKVDESESGIQNAQFYNEKRTSIQTAI